MNPQFSIVIPTYSRPESLQRCLESLTRLEDGDGIFEVMLIDDVPTFWCSSILFSARAFCFCIGVSVLVEPVSAVITLSLAVVTMLINMRLWLFHLCQRRLGLSLLEIPVHVLYFSYSGLGIVLGCVDHHATTGLSNDA